MNLTKRTSNILLGLVVLVLTISCQSQEPIIIYIMPTDQHATSMAQTAIPTEVVASPQIVQPTETSPQTIQVTDETGTPVPTFVGPVIDENYTFPTQAPTATTIPAINTAVVTALPPLPDLDASQMGIQIDHERSFDKWAYALDRTTELGVGWLKIQLAWRRLQEDGPDQDWGPSWQELEGLLLNAEARGINVMISIAKAPEWSRSYNEGDGPPDDPQMLVNFLSIFFSKPGAQSIDALEVWNEPNLRREWQGQPMTGASYMIYFDAVYDAMRAGFLPHIPIITAGLAPTVDTEESRDDRTYLQEMYNAGLATNHERIHIGIHPYGWGNPPDARCCDLSEERGWDDNERFFFLDNLDDYREIMNNNGHSSSQLWVTEFGWATWDGFPGAPPDVWMSYSDRWDQANYTIRAFEIGQQRSDVGVMFLWNLNFGEQLEVERRDERSAYSILPFTQIRPAFWMIYDAIRPGEIRSSYE